MAEEKRSRVNLNCFDDTTSASVFANKDAGTDGLVCFLHRFRCMETRLEPRCAECARGVEAYRMGWRRMVLSLAGAVRRGSLR